MPGKRIVLCTYGSLGDLFPILALGIELKRRGHSPVIATSALYRQRIEALGLAFHSVGPQTDSLDPAILKRAMHPRDGSRYVLCELVLPHLRQSYAQTVAAAEHADLIVTHPIALWAFLFARHSGIPWATAALAPVSMLSVHDMCVFPGIPMGIAEWLATLGPRYQRLSLKIFESAWEHHWKPFRAFERELGLPRSRNPILLGHSPQLALALFSPLLAAPQPDWPPNSHATGFPFLDVEQETPPELQRFLDKGEPPIVFTLGSAAVEAAGDFFSESVKAACLLGRRAVLLSGSDAANQAVSEVPAEVIAVPYAPHSAVFPGACVNVHHGGIGTTAEAMRAGRPMLVVPYAHDQPDNAHRLKKMGAARSIPRSHYHAELAARELDALIRDPGYSERSRVLGSRVRAESGTTAACDLLEGLLGITRTETVTQGAEERGSRA